MRMQEEKEAESTLFEEIKEYLSVRSKIFSLQLAESAATLLSNLIANAAAILFFIIFFVFASVGLAFLVAQWIDNTAGGFFIVAAFYLIIGLVIWMVKDGSIERPLTNIFIRNFFKGKEDDEEDK